PRDATFVMEDLGMRTRASPRTISSSVSRRMVDSASRILPEPSSTRARHFVSYPMTNALQRGDDRGRRLSAEFATERAEIRVDGRGVAHEKTRNEAEDRIVNRAALDDGDCACCRTGRLDTILPASAEREVFVCDASDQTSRWLEEVGDVGDGAVAR